MYRLITIIIISAGLSACGWVDSKGNSGGGVPAGTIVDGGQLLLQEESSNNASLTPATGNFSNWQWRSKGVQTNSDCAINSGFDNELTADSLTQACTNRNACEIKIEEQSDENGTGFLISTPKLKAPIAMGYTLDAIDAEGNNVSLEQTLCLVSINEAPVAEPSNYTVLQNLTRVIKTTDVDNLLNKVTDDDDVRNQDLRISEIPLQAPKYASEFELGTDGSFFYRPAAPTGDPSEVFADEFIYELTDGVHKVPVTVTLNIVDDNRAPIRTEFISLIAISVEDHGETGFSDELFENFTDPDDDELTFSVSQGSLPPSGNITLSSNGVLSGKPDEDDIGDYLVTIIASDGVGQAADTFILSIAEFSTQNTAPEAEDIPNRTFNNVVFYDVAEYFSDDDGDELSFSASGLPSGISITASGLIRGFETSSNRGSWFVMVTANDGRGGMVTDSFRLRIR